MIQPYAELVQFILYIYMALYYRLTTDGGKFQVCFILIWQEGRLWRREEKRRREAEEVELVHSIRIKKIFPTVGFSSILCRSVDTSLGREAEREYKRVMEWRQKRVKWRQTWSDGRIKWSEGRNEWSWEVPFFLSGSSWITLICLATRMHIDKWRNIIGWTWHISPPFFCLPLWLGSLESR